MTRLFVSMKIPEEIRRQIIILRDSILPDPHKYKWEPEEKIHLTLKFIGEVKDELVNDIADEIEFLGNFEKFNCCLSRFGIFYVRNEPKILWLGLNINPWINELVEKLNLKLQKFSIPAEKRKFKAHLTLKRLKGKEGKDFVKRYEKAAVPELKFVSNEIVLMKSELRSSGSIYKEIKNYYLK